MADAAKRKLVEVFIDTDSESESHTSSEMEVATVSDDVAGTLTAEEVGVVSEGEGPREDMEEGTGVKQVWNMLYFVTTPLS